MDGGTVAARPAPNSLVSEVRSAFERGVDWLFEGSVASSIYSTLRIGTALIFLVRHADWLRPWFFLEHHRFVRGLMFLEPSAAEPRLLSPIIQGFSLGDGATRALVFARTLLSVFLLFGVRGRLTAGLLGVVSYTLLLADRYRYYHHLNLLYVCLLFLALAPIGSSLSVERGVKGLLARLRHRVPAPSSPSSWFAPAPIWPLQLIRALVIGVYVAAGISKMNSSFVAGDALWELERFYVLKGPVWELIRDSLGYAWVARLALLAELSLPVALMLRPTRRIAVVGGWVFHAGISSCMPVYSFGAQMALLLLAFWPTLETPTRFVDGSRRPRH
jgi:hypothetical protein